MNDVWSTDAYTALSINDLSALQLIPSARDLSALGRAQREQAQRHGRTIVIRFWGIHSQRVDSMLAALLGGTSTDEYGQAFDEAVADDSVKRIVLHVDSPGGNVHGSSELANKIFKARGRKSIIAHIDAQAIGTA